MLHSHLPVVVPSILAIVFTLTSCSEPRVAQPTRAGSTPTTVSMLVASGIATATVPLAANPTSARSSSPKVATSTNLATLGPENSAVVTAIARTPQPTPLTTPPPNETSIVPGQTEAQVLAVLGEPRSKSYYRGMDVWQYRSPKIPTLLEVSFVNGRVNEMNIQTPGLTAEMVVAQYGVPAVVLFYPQMTLATPEPPAASPRGVLVYPSKGIQFEFVCWPTRLPPCTGVPREVEISVKLYFVPATLGEWVGQQTLPPRRVELRPWTGFAD